MTTILQQHPSCLLYNCTLKYPERKIDLAPLKQVTHSLSIQLNKPAHEKRKDVAN